VVTAAGDRQARRFLRSTGLPLVLVGGYQLYALRGHNLYFPPLGEIASAFGQTWLGPGFTQDVLPSLVNLAVGYGLGVTLGVLCGIGLGSARVAFAMLSPVVSFVLTLPPVALLPLFVTALGVGPSMQVGVIVFGVFFVMLVTTANALRGVDPHVRDMATSFGIKGPRRLAGVLLPAMAAPLLGGLRASLSLAVLVMVVSELVGASHGIGAATLLAQQSFEYAQMWSGMVLLAALGIGLNAGFSALERPVLRRRGLLAAPHHESEPTR
jgi:ABC-type nitrate/sulfonate/bicarbonate transport system permease component